MRGRRVLTGLAAIAVSTLLTAGCGGSSGGDDFASKSTDDILAAAKAAVHEQKTYRVVGSGAQLGQEFALRVRVNDETKTAAGSATVQGKRIRFITAGDYVYVKAPATFYEQVGLTKAQIDLAADTWLKAPLSDPNFGQFASYADADAYLTPSSEVEKGDESTVDGYKTIALVSDRGRLYVRTTEPTLPVKLESTQGGGGSVTFDQFGEPVTVTAPPKSVDIADVQSAGKK